MRRSAPGQHGDLRTGYVWTVQRLCPCASEVGGRAEEPKCDFHERIDRVVAGLACIGHAAKEERGGTRTVHESSHWVHSGGIVASDRIDGTAMEGNHVWSLKQREGSSSHDPGQKKPLEDSSDALGAEPLELNSDRSEKEKARLSHYYFGAVLVSCCPSPEHS